MFFVKIALAILDSLNFHINLRVSLVVYTKMPVGVLIRFILNLGENLGNIVILTRQFSNPWMCCIFLFWYRR